MSAENSDKPDNYRPRKSREMKNRGELTTKNYDKTLHRIAQAMYEIEGMSSREISEELGIGKNTVLNWKRKELWKKRGADVALVNQLTRQNFLEKIAKQGMPTEKALQVLIDGMNNPNTEEVIGVDGDGKAIVRTTPDHATIHKYMKEFFKMAGMMDAPGKDTNSFTAGEGGVLNVQVNLPALED